MVSKRCLTLCLLLLWSVARSQPVTVEPPSGQLSTDQPFNINFVIQGQSNHSMPDFSRLEQSFQILATAKSSQITVLNGKIQAQTIWQLTLRAKKAGNLIIPKIQFGKSSSAPTSIKVAQTQSIGERSDHGNLWMTAETDVSHSYVQQQITYRVKMYYQTQPISGNFSPPQVSQGSIQALGESRNYQTTRNGSTYQVVEQDYAVFAEKPGNITIESPIFKGLVSADPLDQSNDPFFLSQHQPVQLAAKPSKLTIKAVPPSYPANEPFLPAEQVSISERWEGLNNRLNVGEPITRIITLKADGLMASQLPDLKLARTDGLNHYLQPTKGKDHLSGHHIVGTKEFKVVYIPDRPGTIKLAEVKIPWWNTNTKQLSYAQLSAPTLSVFGQPSTHNTTTPTTRSPAAATSPSAPAVHQPTTSQTPLIYRWQILLPWVLLTAVLLAWALQARKQRYHLASTPGSTPTRGDSDHPTNKNTVLKQLKRACIDNRGEAAKSALLKWAKLHWPNQTLLSLGGLKAAVNDQAFASEIDALQAALYHAPSQQWQGKTMWATVVGVEAKLKKTKQAVKR